METCPVCGAPMEAVCKFDVPKEHAPWLADYYLMSTGEMSHQEHQVMVARWNLHHQAEISAKVLSWARDIVQRDGNV